MKTKTSELTGSALDWAVANCEGNNYCHHIHLLEQWEPSLDWAQGGPIIAREKIWWSDNGDATSDQDIWWCLSTSDPVTGEIQGLTEQVEGLGPTLLVAAMRCYVASKLGDEVEIPEELA
jgi:hypothetical protein